MKKPDEVSKGWCVYFIQSGEGGPIKIGYTKNVNARIKAAQTFNPEELRLLAMVVCRGESQARVTEEKFHFHLRKFRVKGEWFEAKIVKELKRIMDETDSLASKRQTVKQSRKERKQERREIREAV